MRGSLSALAGATFEYATRAALQQELADYIGSTPLLSSPSTQCISLGSITIPQLAMKFNSFPSWHTCALSVPSSLVIGELSKIILAPTLHPPANHIHAIDVPRHSVARQVYEIIKMHLLMLPCLAAVSAIKSSVASKRTTSIWVQIHSLESTRNLHPQSHRQ